MLWTLPPPVATLLPVAPNAPHHTTPTAAPQGVPEGHRQDDRAGEGPGPRQAQRAGAVHPHAVRQRHALEVDERGRVAEEELPDRRGPGLGPTDGGGSAAGLGGGSWAESSPA